MINRIHDYMIHNKMIEEGGCILAAVSGGADSMCLLEILRELQAKAGFQLRVLHVHHGLRESAEGDLEYVAGYCAASGIPFEAVRVDAAGYAAEAGMSVEEAARHLRYEALESAAERWDCENKPKSDSESSQQTEDIHCRIAVAHHLEENGRIIRPLLECSRREIEDYLRERGITWREDETNEDIRYARNLLRREVMPLLEKINAGAVQHIAKAAEEAAETEEFLRIETEKAVKACR